MANCASCGAEILWAVTPAGKATPIDSGRDAEKGNVLVLSPRGLAHTLAVVLSGALLTDARRLGVPLHLNHWATCPDRAEWRERTDAKRKAESGDG